MSLFVSSVLSTLKNSIELLFIFFSMFQKLSWGPVLIMIAASMWAIDALFRTQLTFAIPPASIVMLEHLLGFLILSPIFIKHISDYKKLTVDDWINLVALTIVSSVAGTILFTEALARSFSLNDFATPILLLKLQPIFVIALSALFLKEKITLRFIALAVVALIGSYLISFGTQVVQLSLVGKELIYVLAVGAALCWGSGTILSKRALSKLPFAAATAMRFLLAVPIAYIFSVVLGQTHDFTTLTMDQIWRFVVIASITGGAGAMILYYKGLQKTEAKVSTIAELMYPIVSILIAITALNPYGKPQVLTAANIVGIIILLASILLISLDYSKEKKQ